MLQTRKPFLTSTALAITIAAITIAVSPARAQGPAGTVLYCRHGQDVFLLLADHSNASRGWAAFGGGANPGETLELTAARETEEETRGYVSRTWLAQQIAGQQPVIDNGFALFFAEIPFVPAQRIMNNPTDESDRSTVERQHYAWIPFSEIEASLSKDRLSAADLKINPLYLPHGTKSGSLWNIWVRNMRAAAKQNALPWALPPGEAAPPEKSPQHD